MFRAGPRGHPLCRAQRRVSREIETERAGARPLGPMGQLRLRVSSWGARALGCVLGGGEGCQGAPQDPAVLTGGSACLIKTAVAAGMEPAGPWRARGGCSPVSPGTVPPPVPAPGAALTQPERTLSGTCAATQSPLRGHGHHSLASLPPPAPHPGGAAKRPAHPTLSNNTRGRWREWCPAGSVHMRCAAGDGPRGVQPADVDM